MPKSFEASLNKRLSCTKGSEGKEQGRDAGANQPTSWDLVSLLLMFSHFCCSLGAGVSVSASTACPLAFPPVLFNPAQWRRESRMKAQPFETSSLVPNCSRPHSHPHQLNSSYKDKKKPLLCFYHMLASSSIRKH